MTAIIGIAENGVAYIGGDSAIMFGAERETRMTTKVFRRADMLIGCAGAVLFQNMVQHNFEFPVREPVSTHESYVVAVCMALRKFLKAADITEGGGMIIGYMGHIFDIGTDFSVSQYESGLAAIGSGREYALGAMLALKKLKPEKRILKALAISGEWVPGVCPPYYVFKQETN